MSIGTIHVLKMKTGDDFIAEIGRYVAAQGWGEAYLQGAIGSVRDVVVGNAAGNTLPPPVQKTAIEGPFELLGCTGEIIRRDDGTYFTHIHVCGSLTDATTRGGGLSRATVFRQMKVYLQQVA
jgi:predicted DNA-binding protein with PD1-like motif